MKKMYLISPELLEEAIAGLRVYGGTSTEITVIKLSFLKEIDLQDNSNGSIVDCDGV